MSLAAAHVLQAGVQYLSGQSSASLAGIWMDAWHKPPLDFFVVFFFFFHFDHNYRRTPISAWHYEVIFFFP